MSKQKQTTEAQSKKNNQHRNQSITTTESTYDMTGWDTINNRRFGTIEGASVEAQTALLDNRGLSIIQKNALLGKIGHIKGNRYLQGVITDVKRKSIMIP